MTIDINKYKAAVATQEPFVVTGVMNGNDIEWEWVGNEYTCIDCDEWESAWLKDNPDATPDEADEYFYHNWSCENHTHLYGDWKKDDDGLWDVDKNGSDGYAFIYDSNNNTVQVAWSKLVKWTWPCSPCYPGQGDVDEESRLVDAMQPWRPHRTTLEVGQLLDAISIIVGTIASGEIVDRARALVVVNEMLNAIGHLNNNIEVHNMYWLSRAYGKPGEYDEADRYDWLMAHGWEAFGTSPIQRWVISDLPAWLGEKLCEKAFGIERAYVAYALPVTEEEWELLDALNKEVTL